MALQTETPSPTPQSRNGFTLADSPPLILAFLAVAILGLSMAGFIVYRRWVAPRQPWAATNGETRDYILPTELPKMYQLWGPASQDGVTPISWKTIQPLSATIDAGFAPSIPHTPQAALLPTQTLRRRLHLPEPAKLSESPPRSARLRIAVAIAMPAADFSEPEQGHLLEYSVGLCEMPWEKYN
ncbi:hypothetical protein MKEN_01184400 [Mycena kentingensis (nom. inval.)]|nr:hypothetical protein MKEN_01184400 [Mycena kentingensis (nom. inval.)]